MERASRAPSGYRDVIVPLRDDAISNLIVNLPRNQEAGSHQLIRAFYPTGEIDGIPYFR